MLVWRAPEEEDEAERPGLWPSQLNRGELSEDRVSQEHKRQGRFGEDVVRISGQSPEMCSNKWEGRISHFPHSLTLTLT